MSIRRLWETLAVAALILSFAGIYARFQPAILAGDGQGWDGKAYFKLYLQFRGDSSGSLVQYPFCKRTGLPFLAVLLPLSPSSAFRSLNIGSGCLAALVAYLALRRRFDVFVSLVCVLPLVCYLFAPVRFPNFYPYYVDPPATLCYALAAFCLVSGNLSIAVAALLVSAFFREAGFYYAVLLILSLAWFGQISTAKLWGLLGLTGLSLVLQHHVQAEPCAGSQFALVLPNLLGKYGKLDSFLGPLRLVAACSLTLAPFVLIKADSEHHRDDWLSTTSLVLLVASVVMAAFGGSDTTRILSVAFPLYVFYLARRVSHAPPLKVVFLSAAGLIANSFAKRIPEPTAYAPDNDIAGFFGMFPDYSHVGVVVGILAYWLIGAHFAYSVDWNAWQRRLIRSWAWRLHSRDAGRSG